jgi:Mor family transcriptional regulator
MILMSNENTKNLELLKTLVGSSLWKQIINLFGGDSIYIPYREDFNRDERNAEIRQKFFGGASPEELALEYDLSVSHTRTIINQR